jgi:hypothetical protein
VVAIAGGPPFGHYYKDAFQELDLLSMFKPVTKLAIQVNKPERIPEILHYALRSAMTGRKGPVFIDIPRDVLNNHVLQTEIVPPGAYRPDYPSLPHPESIREAVRLLQQAERPLMSSGVVSPGLAPAPGGAFSEQYATRSRRMVGTTRPNLIPTTSSPSGWFTRGGGGVPSGRSLSWWFAPSGQFHDLLRPALYSAWHTYCADRYRQP